MSSYAVVLRVPHARRTFAFALLGRLSYGVVPLSVMLAVTRATGSYAVAAPSWPSSAAPASSCPPRGRP